MIQTLSDALSASMLSILLLLSVRWENHFREERQKVASRIEYTSNPLQPRVNLDIEIFDIQQGLSIPFIGKTSNATVQKRSSDDGLRALSIYRQKGLEEK